VLAFFSRIPRCVVGLEACATAHYWARELGALGHEVRLMPAQYVKAYIKRNKHSGFCWDRTPVGEVIRLFFLSTLRWLCRCRTVRVYLLTLKPSQ
jgi:hypothetical protein